MKIDRELVNEYLYDTPVKEVLSEEMDAFDSNLQVFLVSGLIEHKKLDASDIPGTIAKKRTKTLGKKPAEVLAQYREYEEIIFNYASDQIGEWCRVRKSYDFDENVPEGEKHRLKEEHVKVMLAISQLQKFHEMKAELRIHRTDIEAKQKLLNTEPSKEHKDKLRKEIGAIQKECERCWNELGGKYIKGIIDVIKVAEVVRVEVDDASEFSEDDSSEISMEVPDEVDILQLHTASFTEIEQETGLLARRQNFLKASGPVLSVELPKNPMFEVELPPRAQESRPHPYDRKLAELADSHKKDGWHEPERVNKKTWQIDTSKEGESEKILEIKETENGFTTRHEDQKISVEAAKCLIDDVREVTAEIQGGTSALKQQLLREAVLAKIYISNANELRLPRGEALDELLAKNANNKPVGFAPPRAPRAL